jgi:hypothetical protein
VKKALDPTNQKFKKKKNPLKITHRKILFSKNKNQFPDARSATQCR